MPPYSATSPCTSLAPGDQGTFWDTDSPATGASSKRFFLQNPYNTGAGNAVIDIVFSADPGAFQIDIQAADNDSDDDYLPVLLGSITTVDSTTFKASVAISPWVYKFIRLNMQNDPANAVTVTAKVTH